MASQFDLTRFYDVILLNLVFQLGFLTREFQISKLWMDRCLKFGCVVIVISFVRKRKVWNTLIRCFFLLENKMLCKKNKNEKKNAIYRCHRCIHNPIKHLRWSFLLKSCVFFVRLRYLLKIFTIKCKIWHFKHLS